MKKQILTLRACAAFWTPTSGFCMKTEENLSESHVVKRITLNIHYEKNGYFSDILENFSLSY